jgi:dissimilatory sulfite reductase (desulfoviridin) alpha/beta subunit
MCIWCGDCIRACPTEAWKAKRYGQIVRIGGRHGRHPMESFEVYKFLPDELIPDVIEKTIEWYNANGIRGERIGTTLKRVGLGKYMEFMADTFDGKTAAAS